MFDFITRLITEFTYVGIALLMFLENIFPPIPSELIMPLAGFEASKGKINIYLAILSGSIGSLAGTSIWYWIGHKLGQKKLSHFIKKYGKWLTITPNSYAKGEKFFDKHSNKAVLLGRLIPGVRSVISLPAGVVQMSLNQFLIFSSLGTVIWTALLTVLGFVLEAQFHKVKDWLNPASNIIFGILIAMYFYRAFKSSTEKK